MQVLRQSTQIIVRMGPFMDATDGVTPETGITLGAADQAEALKAAGAATVDISGATFAAVTGCDGWYDLTLTTGFTDTVGTLEIVIQDSSVTLGVFKQFQVIEEAVYDAMYASTAAGPLQSTVAARKLDVTATGAGGIDWGNVENKATANDLSATDIQLVDTTTANTDMRGTDGVDTATMRGTDGVDTATMRGTDSAVLASTVGVAGVGLTDLGGMSTGMKGEVNFEVLDVISVDTFAEPSGVPAATSTLVDKLSWLYTLSRNKGTQTSTLKTLRNDADSADIATSTISDNGTLFTREEWT